MLSFASLRCARSELFLGLVMSWVHGVSGLSESLTMEHLFSLFHYRDVVLPVQDLLFFVEVDQFLVHRLIEQLEILVTSLDIVVFPEPILSSAGVVQRVLDSVVAERLPSAVHGDLVLNENQLLVCLVSPYFCCYFRYHNCSLILKSLICFLRKSR